MPPALLLTAQGRAGGGAAVCSRAGLRLERVGGGREAVVLRGGTGCRAENLALAQSCRHSTFSPLPPGWVVQLGELCVALL